MNSTSNHFHQTFDLKTDWPDSLLLKKIVDLDQKEFQYPWNYETWLKLKDSERSFRLDCYLEQEEIISFSLYEIIEGENLAHLLKIMTQSICQKQGKASELIEYTFAKFANEGIEKIILEVNSENRKALNFYKKQGFIELNLVKGFYSDGADAKRLIKELKT